MAFNPSFGTSGGNGTYAFELACRWQLVLDGVVMAKAVEKSHLARTKEVLGGGLIEPIEKGAKNA